MAEDETLLHPLIRAELPKARQRVKYYKEKGLITLPNGAVSIAALAAQQGQDLKARLKTEKALAGLQQRRNFIQQMGLAQKKTMRYEEV